MPCFANVFQNRNSATLFLQYPPHCSSLHQPQQCVHTCEGPQTLGNPASRLPSWVSLPATVSFHDSQDKSFVCPAKFPLEGGIDNMQLHEYMQTCVLVHVCVLPAIEDTLMITPPLLPCSLLIWSRAR